MREFRVVVSGFEHYEGVETNPSFEVPLALAGTSSLQSTPAASLLDGVEAHISAVTLPISFAHAWPKLHETLERVQPDIVIATGLKRRARGIALERCATNIMDAHRPDADNLTPQPGPIVPGAPAAYWTRLPLRSILGDFADFGIAATLSSDAGTYVCNSLFYQLLHWSASHHQVLSGFVSLPPVVATAHSQYGLTLPIQIDACADVVAQAIRYSLKPTSSQILLT